MHAEFDMIQGGVTTYVVLRLIHGRRGINLRWLNNSVLLLTVVFTLSVHRSHYTQKYVSSTLSILPTKVGSTLSILHNRGVIIRCTWNCAYFKHDKIWDLLRELIPTWFLSRLPQRKCRNVCKHDCLQSRMSVFQIIFTHYECMNKRCWFIVGKSAVVQLLEKCTGNEGSIQ